MKKIIAGILTVSAFVLLAGVLSVSKSYAENNGQNGEHGNSEQRGFGDSFNDKHEDHDKQKKEAHSLGSTLEVHIGDDGKVLVRGAKVTSVSGTTVNATTTWGSVVMNWAITTDGNTEFVRRFGGASGVSEISVNDFVSFSGMILTTTASPITVQAKVLKNWSVQRAHATFNGSVTSINADAKSFVLQTEERGTITVQTTADTKIVKEDATALFTDIAVGTKITAGGLYDNALKILTADGVKIHKGDAIRTTLEGKVKTAPASTTAPTTFVITANNTDYTVNVGVDTSVLNNLWLKSTLANITIDSKIRVYGTVNSNNTVDATVVRSTF